VVSLYGPLLQNLEVLCKILTPVGSLNRPSFCMSLQIPLPPAIPRGPPFSPPNVGPTLFPLLPTSTGHAPPPSRRLPILPPPSASLRRWSAAPCPSTRSRILLRLLPLLSCSVAPVRPSSASSSNAAVMAQEALQEVHLLALLRHRTTAASPCHRSARWRYLPRPPWSTVYGNNQMRTSYWDKENKN
jgi:hypothetical protein